MRLECTHGGSESLVPDALRQAGNRRSGKYWRELCKARTAFILSRDCLRRVPPAHPCRKRTTLAELAFREGIWDQIRLRETRFHERAYLFVLAALEFQQSRMPERRHIDGRELSRAVRDLALDRFGVTARLVLEHWGVTSTKDLGDIVFTMVELGLLMSQPSDSRDDFHDVFAFDKAFESAYPWSAAHLG